MQTPIKLPNLSNFSNTLTWARIFSSSSRQTRWILTPQSRTMSRMKRSKVTLTRVTSWLTLHALWTSRVLRHQGHLMHIKTGNRWCLQTTCIISIVSPTPTQVLSQSKTKTCVKSHMVEIEPTQCALSARTKLPKMSTQTTCAWQMVRTSII